MGVITVAFIGMIVFLSHLVEGITGFGCMILALPFVSALLGLKTAVPVLVILSTLFDLALVAKDAKKINWREAWIIILVAGAFMPIGFWALSRWPEDLLMLLLGIFVLAAAVWGLVQNSRFFQHRRPHNTEKSKSPNKSLPVLFLPLAGLVQGAFGGSGPFMILYARTKLTDKTVFRATMATVWIVLNLVNLVQYAFGGMLTAQVLQISALLIPCIAAGFAAGLWAHRRISQDKFTKLIYVTLFVTGVSMIF